VDPITSSTTTATTTSSVINTTTQSSNSIGTALTSVGNTQASMTAVDTHDIRTDTVATVRTPIAQGVTPESEGTSALSL